MFRQGLEITHCHRQLLSSEGCRRYGVKFSKILYENYKSDRGKMRPLTYGCLGQLFKI